MTITYAQYQSVLDRLNQLEKWRAKVENDLRVLDYQFEVVADVKEDMDARLVHVEHKVFPHLGEALRQIDQTIGKPGEGDRHRWLDVSRRIKPPKKK